MFLLDFQNNLILSNRLWRFISILESRTSSNDAYEYNSDEINLEKIVGDFVPIEEKRSSQAGCDCQLSVGCIITFEFSRLLNYIKLIECVFTVLKTSFIDLGPASFPRHIRNVTCDQHKRCYHSRAKGLRCLPIHYEVIHLTETNFFNFNLIEILRKRRNRFIKLSFHVGECDKEASKSNRPERDWFVYITTDASMLLESDENSHNCWLHLRTALKFDKKKMVSRTNSSKIWEYFLQFETSFDWQA